MDPKTIAVYDEQAVKYANTADNDRHDPALISFIGSLPKGAQVLDLGCGPGQAAAEMARAGLVVTAVDASTEMVAMAAKLPGVSAHQATFDQIAGENIYDGIWANFCLLHAPRADMPSHLGALVTALKPGGRFHIALKTGTGEQRDKIGRFYTFYEIDEVQFLLTAAGLTVTGTTTGEDPGLDGTISPWFTMSAHA